ncbi:MAG: carboxypeptidase regulatory-like domain-containing protein [Acidimicrobiales bacterium]
MRLEVEPLNATVLPGQPTLLTVRVLNTGTVISGHRIRMLGVDPRWVSIDQEQLSLFPDAAGVAVLTVTLPKGIPAGVRRVSVEVQELTPPHDRAVVEVELTVPAELGLKVALDPVSVTGGKRATIGVAVDNIGNSPVDIDLAGTDEEAQVLFAFKPPGAILGPGERTLATALLRAKRPFWGSPKIRPFKVNVGPAQPPVSAFGTWIQKPLLTRGAIAIMGLVLAITVFAGILTLSLSRVVGQSTADRNLSLQVAQAGQTGTGGGGTSAISGMVSLLTSGMGVDGVTVEVFNASQNTTPLASVATGAGGTYTFQGLAAGTYKLRFSGAGFNQLWYPAALTPDNAGEVQLSAGQKLTDVNVLLGGVPATLKGTVVGSNPDGATVTLEALVSAPTAASTGTPATTTTIASGPAVAGPTGGTTPAVVTSVTVDASGAFTLANIPSPSTYDLVVAKQGFATVTQEVDLGSGEQRTGIVITLVQGNGSIMGQVNGPSGALGGATISATDGQTTVSTVSLTQGAVGTFTLSNLPTPATLTLTVASTGFATQTLSVSLASGEQLTGVSVTLASGSGSIAGQVSLSTGGPATGVTVKVTNGQLSLTTVTLSSGTPGSYQVTGLAVPGTYTITFSRPDLVSQTKDVTLNALPASNLTGIDATMVSANASLTGVVTATNTTSCLPAGTTGAAATVTPINVTLSSGTASYAVSTATTGTIGAYAFDNVAPGTYTVSFSRQGGQPTTFIETLTAGSHVTLSPTLPPAASICGIVYQTSNGVAPGLGTPPTPPPPPMPAAQVEVQLFPANAFPGGPSQQVLTGNDGSFEFDNVTAPQSYIVQFEFPQGSAGQFTVATDASLSKPDLICDPFPTAGAKYCLVNTSGATQ